MNKYLYTAGAFTTALAMSGFLATVASAEETTVDGVRVTTETVVPAKAQLRAELQEKMDEVREVAQERRTELASGTDKSALSEEEREELKQKAEQIREDAKQQREEARETFKSRLELLREGTSTPARSLEHLKQLIQERREMLDDEAASTTPEVRRLFNGAKSMSVAVHALLASRDLLGGGIGEQVSDIARRVDDSAATTTNAEAKIHSRGFLTKLLCGGDKTAANIISQEVAQNQGRIDALTALLSQANVPVDIQTELNAQITALKEAQARLESVAQGEKKSWGIFSWRL